MPLNATPNRLVARVSEADARRSRSHTAPPKTIQSVTPTVSRSRVPRRPAWWSTANRATSGPAAEVEGICQMGTRRLLAIGRRNPKTPASTPTSIRRMRVRLATVIDSPI
ncbi:hypothetical protein [Amycolatopsis sp. NBC_01480]|uniref:hypothetical protein n=1 Tax=Amycolatopsis sp. NBC_01480 TaxID=2903562 RepID=UPI002E2A3D3D|nr:hypothetical protein [Amycolatopsis sp. NBC_01480]